MNIFAKPAAILGLAGAIALAIPTVSTAQVPYDTWSHVVNPTPYGLCWVPTDQGPYKEFGYGYWGACKGAARAAAPLARAEARRARAEARYARAEAWRARAEVEPVVPGPYAGVIDPWSYVASPAPNGLCWVPFDKPYMEFGYGHWGACPASATAAPAMRARAQAVRKSHKKKSYR